jgi:hypothetical protein
LAKVSSAAVNGIAADLSQAQLMNLTIPIASFKTIGLFLVLTGCAQPRLSAGIEYDIGFLNKTGRDLGGVCVYYGKVEAAAKGSLVKCGEATFGAVTLPVPPEAEMRWTDNGQQHSVKVKLPGAVPKRLTYEWTLYFVINRDGTVQSKALKDGDKAGYAELEKGLIPAGEYQIGFVNKTGRDVEAISASAGGTKLLEYEMLIGGGFTYSGYLDPPIAFEAELQWKQGGAPHALKVKLADVPKDFEGIIYFVAEPDGRVEVHPVIKGDDKATSKIIN